MADATHPEEWRPVLGYEGRYEVSNAGSVRSLLWGKVRVLRQSPDRDGYPRVALHRQRQQVMRRVHTIVAEAFIGPRPEGQEVRHLDGIKAHNDLGNLAYGTHTENAQDSLRLGISWPQRETHCKRGHPFDEANTRHYVTSRGHHSRECRICSRIRTRAKRAGIPATQFL